MDARFRRKSDEIVSERAPTDAERPAPTRVGDAMAVIERASAHLVIVPAVQDSDGVADRDLATRIRAGDVGAFEVMFHTYYAPLHAFVSGFVRNPDVADECVQDVMHRVWTLGPRWELRGSIRRYLYTAARNRALNHIRHGHVVGRWEAAAIVDVEVSGIGQGPESTDAACRRHELAAALRAALGRLPERRREALMLRTQHQMNNPEIAKVMGISVKNVERHIMLALRALRVELDAFF